jgi:hypothetical protein
VERAKDRLFADEDKDEVWGFVALVGDFFPWDKLGGCGIKGGLFG